MTEAEKLERLAMLEELKELREEKAKRARNRKLLTYFPDSGPLRRELYPKHLEFFAAGPAHRERLMLAANRVGKTEGVGGYELTLHLTGMYPAWWNGRRYERPIRAWAAGDTSKTVREILQHKLLGPPGSWGTGLIPGDAINRVVRAAGAADTVDTVYVRHSTGGLSSLGFKSYDQRREAFQGTEQDIIWLDEEPPLDVYTECLLRTMTCNGMLMLTFTPLLGMSEVVLLFLPGGRMEVPDDSASGVAVNGGAPVRFTVMATWDDAPHLSKEAKDELWNSIPPFQRDARSKGIPQLGAGAIYPVEESRLLCDPVLIPPHWPRGYGMDVGWNFTAAIWGALDRDTDTLYLTHEYKRGQCEPAVHVHGIGAPGRWIPGFIDPAARGRSQKDGSQLIHDYRNLGLKLYLAENAVESGLYAVWQRMEAGKLKVFRNLAQWLGEFRLYRRDEKGHVEKANDHLMDAMRYLESGISKMKTKPKAEDEPKATGIYYPGGDSSRAWMA